MPLKTLRSLSLTSSPLGTVSCLAVACLLPLGWYASPSQDVKQVRAGWDSSYKLGLVRFIPSIQIAS